MTATTPREQNDEPMDPITNQLRRLELGRPDALLRQRVMADVEAELGRRTEAQRPWRPALVLGALLAAVWLSLWAPWESSVSHPEIPLAYVEDTAHWLDVSPELARHVVRPTVLPIASNQPPFEGRLRHAIHTTIDL